MKTIEEIRKAFLAMHHYATKENAPTYMSVPADRERDADLILSDAIDELEKLRANENAPCWAALGEIEGMLGISGSVPVTTAARAVEKLKADLDAAKADAARLGEENQKLKNFFGASVYEWSGDTCTCRICKTTSERESEDHVHETTCPFFYAVKAPPVSVCTCGARLTVAGRFFGCPTCCEVSP